MLYMKKTRTSIEDIKANKLKRGEQLSVATQQILISKLLDYMTQGIYSTYKLAQLTGVSRPTVDRYRPIIDDIIARQKIDRNVIRNLQIRRTYELIEMLMDDLKTCSSIKERSIIYGNIFKFSSHLALITGLNIETQVNVDHKQLVIIRPQDKTTKDPEQTIDVIDAAPIDVTSARELPQITL